MRVGDVPVDVVSHRIRYNVQVTLKAVPYRDTPLISVKGVSTITHDVEAYITPNQLMTLQELARRKLPTTISDHTGNVRKALVDSIEIQQSHLDLLVVRMSLIEIREEVE